MAYCETHAKTEDVRIGIDLPITEPEFECREKRTEEANQALQEALGIYQRFAAKDPEQFRSKVELVESLLEDLKKSNK